MIKISVMYPYSPEGRFDMDYYCKVHMPLVKTRMGEYCRGYEVDLGLSGGAPDSAPVYVAVAHIYCESMDDFRKGFGPHAGEFKEDQKNYTNIASVMQVSELAASVRG
ncbi:EthD family reductase [Ottowia sp. VDI28]|uniref:EthD family reductase n=1 Tax=Ottowia sp. VDI28 TaxID=3133968 RepID=UPI003C3002A6